MDNTTTTTREQRRQQRQERRLRKEERRKLRERIQRFRQRHQQVVAEQAARYEEICQYFLDSVRHTVQFDAVSYVLADRGWIRGVRALYADIVGADSFVSSTACDRLMDLVRFCIAHADDVGGTWRFAKGNSVGAMFSPPGTAPRMRPVYNWLEMRGLSLIRDLGTHLHLYDDPRPRLRWFYVEASGFASAHCFSGELACIPTRDTKRRTGFRAMGDEILGTLGQQDGHADYLIRDAARTALADLSIRRLWRDIRAGRPVD